MSLVRKEDTAKLAGLGGALILVLGFVGFRVFSTLGGSTPPPPPPAVAPAPTPVASRTLGTLTTPYSELPAPQEPNPFRNVLLNDQQSMPPIHSAATVNPLPGADEGARGFGPVEVKPAPIPLRLDGVLAGSSPAAIVTMGDRTDILAVGGSIGGYTLTSVDSKAATFDSKDGVCRLLVGEETRPVVPELPKVKPFSALG